ncbi:MAG: hypothetical protein ACHQ16_02445 [Candidatus Lutacidiplasmatales archaeon]
MGTGADAVTDPQPPDSRRVERRGSGGRLVLSIVALIVGVVALVLSGYTLVALSEHQLPPAPAAQTLFSGTISSQPVAYTGETDQQAIQSITVGGTQSTNALNSHLLSLAVTLSYPCPYYKGEPTGILDASNCLVGLIQGKTILESTIAFIPTNETIIDYNLLIPSGPFNLVVIVIANTYVFPPQTASTFGAAIVLDDLGQTGTS